MEIKEKNLNDQQGAPGAASKTDELVHKIANQLNKDYTIQAMNRIFKRHQAGIVPHHFTLLFSFSGAGQVMPVTQNVDAAYHFVGVSWIAAATANDVLLNSLSTGANRTLITGDMPLVYLIRALEPVSLFWIVPANSRFTLTATNGTTASNPVYVTFSGYLIPRELTA